MKKRDNTKNGAGEMYFTFGDPEEVQQGSLLDYLGVFPEGGGEYYIPPLSLTGLAKMKRANCHHGSCILFRRNMAANAYRKGGLSVSDFCKAVTDYLTFGNAYIELLYNTFGKVAGLRHVPALNMRVRTDRKGFRLLQPYGRYIDFDPDEMLQASEYDEIQQIYGMPDWLGGLQSALLNEAATLFRRRYYVNGAHVGYILYTNSAKMRPGVREKLEQAFKEGKGVGNFRAAYIDIPNGDPKAVQIIPVGDFSHKDDFEAVKNISAADVFVAHRVPLSLMSVMPQGNNSNLGDPQKYVGVYNVTEVKALCRNFLALNECLPEKLRFEFDFELKIPAANNAR